MKKWKKLITFVLVGVMMSSFLVGCGDKVGESNKGDKKVIEVRAWQAGLGIEWLEKLIVGFEKAYPEYTVRYSSSADAAGVMAPYGQEKVDDTDLYFALQSDPSGLEPLDDVMESQAKGETKKIKEKFSSDFLKSITNPKDDKIYMLTYGGGIVGIVYNKELFKEAGITELPATTNELVLVCDSLLRAGITPWCHFKQGGYWWMMSELFSAQHDGYDYYTNVMYACTDENGKSPSLELLTRKDGRYEVLKMYEKILTPDSVLSGSNSGDHITMQTRFVHGQAAMMVNGAWMSNEMKSVGNTEKFGLMKTPVISSIVDKLSTVKKDSDLSTVIAAIDSVTDGEKTVDDYRKGDVYVIGDLQVSIADWDYISNARNTSVMNYNGNGVFIPNYSNQKEGAKEFLRYMYSDEGYEIMANSTEVSFPFTMDEGELDISKWSDLQKDFVEMTNNTTQYVSGSYNLYVHPIFTNGMKNLFADQLYIQYLTALNKADRASADELWNRIVSYIESNYESNWLLNIE